LVLLLQAFLEHSHKFIEKLYELQQTSSGYELVSEIDAAGFPKEKFVKKKK